MRAAFTAKLAQAVGGKDFTVIESNENFENVKASIEGWGALSGPERRERATALFGDASKSKAYKLAKKYHELVIVGDVPHVLTKGGEDTPDPGARWGRSRGCCC